MTLNAAWYHSVLNIFNISITYSPCFCLNNNRNQIIWENNRNDYMDRALFTFLLLHLQPAFKLWGWLFDRKLIPCETACQDDWQVFVALWDDHVPGKYIKEGKLGSGFTIKVLQQSGISTLVNLSGDQRKTQVWNANWIQCTTLQILSKIASKSPDSWDQWVRCIWGPAAMVLWPAEQ